jgi:hypothetical protein
MEMVKRVLSDVKGDVKEGIEYSIFNAQYSRRYLSTTYQQRHRELSSLSILA